MTLHFEAESERVLGLQKIDAMNFIKRTKTFQYIKAGKDFLTNEHQLNCRKLNRIEEEKRPTRTDIINELLSTRTEHSIYLEIGVRNPDDNFNKIRASEKYSVDPGIDFAENPVDFPMTSDEFFEAVAAGKVLRPNIKFDVIFIDGLHLAEQVDRDIQNSLDFITDDGFIILHDCNPPTEWHARETYRYFLTPAAAAWNGTTWKAFLKWRSEAGVSSCCIDTDWGVGVLSKSAQLGASPQTQNPFFEFKILAENRVDQLNLVGFEAFQQLIKVPVSQE